MSSNGHSDTEAAPRASGERVGVGIVGVGARGLQNLAMNLCAIYGQHRLAITAIYDNHPQRLADARTYLEGLFDTNGIAGRFRAHDELEALVRDPAVDLVMITTPQDAHEQAFHLAAQHNKLIFCDKPLAASAYACDRMLDTYHTWQPRVMIGFTRRYEPAWMKAAQLIADGVIGTPHMLLLRCIIPSHIYFHTWMRQRAASGGLLNEKCAHHFDALSWYAGAPPRTVYANGGRRVFVPKPDYPTHCSACDLDCPYRWGAGAPRVSQDQMPSSLATEYADDTDRRMSHELCVFSPETDIVDHATVNVTFGNGMVGQLFFSVFGQHAEDQETIEVVGDRGRINVIRHAGRVDVITAFGNEHQSHDCRGSEFQTMHFGADRRLLRVLSQFATHGTAPPATIEHAYTASQTSFAAIQSIESGQPVTVTSATSHAASRIATGHA